MTNRRRGWLVWALARSEWVQVRARETSDCSPPFGGHIKGTKADPTVPTLPVPTQTRPRHHGSFRLTGFLPPNGGQQLLVSRTRTRPVGSAFVPLMSPPSGGEQSLARRTHLHRGWPEGGQRGICSPRQAQRALAP